MREAEKKEIPKFENVILSFTHFQEEVHKIQTKR